MSTINTSGGIDSQNTPKKEKVLNFSGLIRDAIYRKFGDPIGGSQFNDYQKNHEAIHDEIRLNMTDIRNENQEEWGDISDDMISSQATNERINQDIAMISKNLIFKRKRLIERSLEIFPLLKDQNNWKNSIATYAGELNENDLQILITRRHSLYKMLVEVFPGVNFTNPLEKRDFDKIFYDKNLYFDETTLIRLEKIHKNYKSGHNIPDGDSIDFLLGVYKNASNTRKKELLSDFSVTLTIKDAFHFGLIDISFLESFSKNEFENIYERLNEEQKKGFIRGLSQDASYVISIKDLNENALGNIFTNPNDRRRLSQEIFRSIALDIPETEKSNLDSIVGRIKERKLKQVLETGIEEDNYDIYDEFIEQLKIEKKEGFSIKNIELLKTKNAVVQFKHPNGSTQYMKILSVRDEMGFPLDIRDGETGGIQCEALNVTNNVLGTPQKLELDYDMFQHFLYENADVSILTNEEFEGSLVDNMNQITDGSGKIFDARTIDSEGVTSENIVNKLNILDPEGIKHGFEVGTAFIAPLHEKESNNIIYDAIWTVKKIHSNNTVDLTDSSGWVAETQLPLDQVYTVLKDIGTSFKRVAKIPDDSQMQTELKEFGVGAIKDGQLYIEETDDHGHKVEKKITCFQGKTAEEHIRMEYLKDGRVRFGEYDSKENISDVKAHTKKHGLDSTIKGQYRWKTMSYATFLRYLQKNKLSATTNDSIIDKKAGHDHGHDSHHHPHVHGSFMSRIFQMQNAASIWKGFEMIWHSIEHTLEKGAKLDAAKFALGTANFLGLPDSVKAQIYSDVVTGSKEILEKIEKKIFDLPGPAGRLKCLHIIENQDSRPEEVAAAMSYMLKSYGHLYAEDIKHKQSIIQNQEHFETAPNGTFMFFDAFVSTAKLGDLHAWRKKAYKKAIGEMGSADNHDGEPTEEQLIHALFKDLDGDWDKFPYAASVLKSLGGPGGFEKIWKFEGYDNAKKKGEDQTKMVSAQGRLNKAIAYLGSHEIYKGIGAMEAVVAKAKSPEFQAFPFVWAVGGFSRYASHTALQDIKGYSENGYSFHAYAFMKTPAENILYKKVVRMALLEKGGQTLVDKFDGICRRMEFNPDKEKHTKEAAMDMMKLWQEHCNGEDGLHDMLQGHNGWLLKGVKDGDPDITHFLENLHGKHDMQLKGESISSDKMQDQYHEWGYRFNRIVGYDKEKGVMSLRKTLNKIKLAGGTKIGDRQMSDDDRDKLWGGIGEHMNTIKNIDSFKGDNDLQKKQFLHFRREIIDFYITNLNARSGSLTSNDINKILALPHKYYADIKNMGIDPRAIFSEDFDKNNAESDYLRWKGGGQSHGGSSHAMDLASFIQGKAAVATTNPSSDRNPSMNHHSQFGNPPDGDLHNPGGVADISDHDGD